MSTSFLQSGRRGIPLGVWVFITAFAVRLLVLVHLSGSPYFLPDNGDMKFYNDWALRILHGQWTDYKAFYGLPGYAFLLAFLYKLAGYNVFIPGLLQTMAEAITSVLIFKISKQIFSPEQGGRVDGGGSRYRAEIIGVVAAAGWIFFQPAQTFSVILMPTSLLVCVFWGIVWFVLSLRDGSVSVWRPWLWLGLAIGVMAMIVATVFFLIPLVIAGIIFNLDPKAAWRARAPRILGATALLFAGVLAGMSPCWIHNYFIAREPVLLSAHSGVNFYIGNNSIANGYPKIPPGMRAGQEGMLQDSITMAEVAAGHPLKRVEVSRFWSAKADAYIHGHFTDWLGLMCVKFKNFWNAYQYDDLSLVTLFANDGILTWGLKFGFVAALAIPGMFVAARKYPRSRWVLAAVLLHMAALLPVFITERYRLAAVPGMLLLGSAGLWELWSWLTQSRVRLVAVYTVGVAGAVAFVAWKPDDVGLWSLDYHNTAIKALDTRRHAQDDEQQAILENDTQRQKEDEVIAERSLALAEKNFDIAFAYVDGGNSEINFGLGNVWLEKNDTTLAKAFYRRTIEINGRHSGAYNNLGVLALGEERWQLAAKFLECSIEIAPDDAKTYYLLAKAKLGGNDFIGADKAVKQALALRPGQKEFEELAAEISKKMKQP